MLHSSLVALRTWIDYGYVVRSAPRRGALLTSYLRLLY